MASESSPDLLALVLGKLPLRIYWRGRDLRFLGCNRAFARDMGLASETEILGREDESLPARDFALSLRTGDREALEGGKAIPEREEERPGEGGAGWIRIRRELLLDGEGGLIGVAGVYEDWSRMHRESEELERSRDEFALAIESSGVGLWDWYLDTGRLVLNARWAEILGYRLEELEPLTIETWSRLCEPGDLERSNKALAAHFAGETPSYECEARMLRKDGTWAWVLDRGKVVERDAAGKPLRVVGTHLDITERKRMEAELLAAASTDKLTGVLNRRAGLEALEREARSAERRDGRLALCFLDLDGLKAANDLLGHAVGDALIAAAARVIQSALRATDSLCRLGGDEFLAILPDLGPEEAEAVWLRIEAAAAREAPSGAPLSMSRGFSFSLPGSRPGADQLVVLADAAMYEDKNRRRGRRGG